MPACIIDQAIQPPVSIDRHVYQPFDLVGLRNVARNKLRLAWSSSVQFRSQGLTLCFMTCAKDNFRPCSDECLDAAFTDSFAAPGYDDHLVFVCHRLAP